MGPRITKTPEERRRIIERWLDIGADRMVTQREFARSYGVTARTFQIWLRELKQEVVVVRVGSDAQ